MQTLWSESHLKTEHFDEVLCGLLLPLSSLFWPVYKFETAGAMASMLRDKDTRAQESSNKVIFSVSTGINSRTPGSKSDNVGGR